MRLVRTVLGSTPRLLQLAHFRRGRTALSVAISKSASSRRGPHPSWERFGRLSGADAFAPTPLVPR
jgi:hypothetical protein